MHFAACFDKFIFQLERYRLKAIDWPHILSVWPEVSEIPRDSVGGIPVTQNCVSRATAYCRGLFLDWINLVRADGSRVNKGCFLGSCLENRRFLDAVYSRLAIATISNLRYSASPQVLHAYSAILVVRATINARQCVSFARTRQSSVCRQDGY